MFKRMILRCLFRLRGFMQEEILSEISVMRCEYQQLRSSCERLRAEHDQVLTVLDRLELLDQTAKQIEDGMLSLALQQEPAELPERRQKIFA